MSALSESCAVEKRRCLRSTLYKFVAPSPRSPTGIAGSRLPTLSPTRAKSEYRSPFPRRIVMHFAT
jgi:hypothetical protein